MVRRKAQAIKSNVDIGLFTALSILHRSSRYVITP